MSMYCLADAMLSTRAQNETLFSSSFLSKMQFGMVGLYKRREKWSRTKSVCIHVQRSPTVIYLLSLLSLAGMYVRAESLVICYCIARSVIIDINIWSL